MNETVVENVAWHTQKLGDSGAFSFFCWATMELPWGQTKCLCCALSAFWPMVPPQQRTSVSPPAWKIINRDACSKTFPPQKKNKQCSFQSLINFECVVFNACNSIAASVSANKRCTNPSHREYDCRWEFWNESFVCMMTFQQFGMTSGRYQTYVLCAQSKHPCPEHLFALITFCFPNLWLPHRRLLCQHAHDQLRVPTEPTPSEQVAIWFR